MVAKQVEIVSQNTICAVTFTNESQVVGGDNKGSIRQWKIEGGQKQDPLMKAGFKIFSIVVSQDGRWIVSGDYGMVVVWNAATHEKTFEFTEHQYRVCAVDISSDSTRIASAGGGTVRISSITSGIPLLPLFRHPGVLGVRFSPDGSRFATVSSGSGVCIYSTHDGSVLFDSGFHGSTCSWPVSPLAWSSDGLELFVASTGKITCFNVSESSSSEWSIHESRPGVSIVSNGKFIACSAGSSVSLWDCASHKQIGSIIKHSTGINVVALSLSGGYLACGIGTNITIHNLRDVLPAQYFYCLHASQFPLMQVSEAALKSWTQDDPTHTETLLSEEVTKVSSASHYVLANRALIRARLKHWALAIEDCKESLRIQPSPIAHIAMATALLGQGNREGALCTFDLAFHDCELHEIKFLLLLKLILVFESGNQEEAITRVEYLVTRANRDNDNDTTHLYTQVLGAMHVKKGSYKLAISLIKRANKLVPKHIQCPPLKTISLIFGWNFNGLDIVVQQRLCETLYAEGHTAEAVKILLDIRKSNEENQGCNAIVDWIADFTKKCAATLEHVGDEAVKSVKHDDAITQYSAALSLSPPNPAGLLLKRSRARVAKGLWEDSLQDANEAVKADPSSPWGYEAKHVSLHASRRYDEALDTFKSMLHVIEQSTDPTISQLRKNYVSPSVTIAAIDSIVREFLKRCPLVVIDVTTGSLCDIPERMHLFNSSPTFKDLVSSMTRELDTERIRRVVASFFGYVMFSHVWQGNEPSFQDVNAVKSIWNLPDTPLNQKLHNFCKETRRLGYNWAWSDTCCIDKTTSSTLNRSLTSMYKWYADSAATLVFLAGVAHPSKHGDLARSLWMTRAWTLQELLAPKVIFFYDCEWKPYLGDTSANHKESTEITPELADAVELSRATITTFSPDNLGVREKLRLASSRNTTIEEDAAYSLIGIFKSDIRPHYGEAADALGHLLEEIVDRSGEVTVLAWSGKSSSYNSCLPASLSVYREPPYSPPSLEGQEMNKCITDLRGKLPQQEARSIYKQIKSLPPPRFATRRLHLPCIIFPVRGLNMQRACRGNVKLYCARVSGLGNVEFATTDDLPLDKPKKIVFAHPWIRHILGPRSGFTCGDDSDSDTESDSDSDCDTTSDVPLHPTPTRSVDCYTRALQLIARLGQPFNTLILLRHPNGRYKRVAAEHVIVVWGLGINVTSKNIRTKVLEIL
ncbi:hypothetical protein EDC04DRAFT_60648 [Pisolithus marmoratus]|nr:hypothetical protein EDC04DRAFT_60648 [Pisolithus marmoratus]